MVRKILNIFGYLFSLTYKYKDEQQPYWKYAYYFFYQRILMFNVHVPWPVHPTTHVTGVKGIKFGKKSAPGTGSNQYIQGSNGIILGNNVRIGPGTAIISANHDPDDYTKHVKTAPIIIGDDVWIGANCVVLPGVTIGSNVVIGAGSIVTKDIPSNSIAFGNPCMVRKEKKGLKENQYIENPV